MDTLRQSNRRPRISKNPPSKIAGTLRDRILAGLYQPGSSFPSERALQADLNVERRVVKAAIEELKTEGFLKQRPNCRASVSLPLTNKVGRGDAASNSNLPASRIIALVMWHGGASDRAGIVQQSIFWGMIDELAEARYHAIFLDVGPNTEDNMPNSEREASCLSYALTCGLGGIVFFPQAFDHNQELMQEVARQVPLVFLDRVVPGVQADVVGAENRQSMFNATWHLIEQGHKRIAFVSSGEYINTVEERIKGYVQAMHMAFPQTAYEMVLTPPFTDSSSWPEFDAVVRLSADERPTAFVCVNNHEAIRVARHLAERGLSVPEDVSLIGFNNVEQTLQNDAALTSISMPFEAIGREAAKLILRRIQNPSLKFVHIEVPTKLVVQDSVRSRTQIRFETACAT